MTHATLVLVRNPFRPFEGREVRAVKRRSRVASLAPRTAQPHLCLYNGQPLMRAQWSRTRVKRGDVVSFVVLPQGGGGGGSNPLRMVLMIAVTLAAPYAATAMGFASGSVAGALAKVAIGMAGTALVNAVLPPPKSPSNHQAAQLAAPSPTYNLPGQQGNQARVGQPVPALYGRHVIFPDYAAMPFYEFLGNEQYGHFLFCLGQGELLIEQVRFDKSDASAYGGDVVMEVIPPGGSVTLFPSNVVSSSEVSGQELPGRKDLTYAQSGETITVTETAHGRTMGNIVKLDITTGAAIDGEFPIASVVDVNHWTVTAADALTTSGNVSVYSYMGGTGFVANQAGTRANQICVDVALPSGLGVVNTTTGAIDPLSVKFYTEILPIDANGTATAPWQMLPPLMPATPASFAVSVMQAKSSWSYTPYPPHYTVTLPSINLSHSNSVSTSIVVKRAGVVVTGWTLSAGTGPSGVDQILIPTAYQTNRSSVSIGWEVSYRIQTIEFEEQISGATNTPQRRSLIYTVTPGRYKVRVTRTDIKNTSAQAFHTLNWVAMEAYIPGAQSYGNVTMMAMRIRASIMTSTAAQKVNVIATRCLPVWDAATGWSAPQPTQSIAWALADAARAQYGGRQVDAQIDLAKLVEMDSLWMQRGDTFNGIFDNTVSLWEAFTSILRAGRAKPLQIGGVLTAVRDQPQQTPCALFSMHNIAQGSFSVDYAFPTAATTDGVEMTYFDEVVWAQRTVMCTLPGDTTNNPAKVQAFGITSRDQAHREGLYMAACNRYRRKMVHLRTEMEGFIPIFGDLVAVQHDVPSWGQHAEVLDYDRNAGELVLSEVFEWTGGSAYYLGLRRRDGSLTTAVQVTQGSAPDRVRLLDPLPTTTLDVGGDRERTHVSFGAGDAWRQQVVVTQVVPRGFEQVEITCVNENPIVHTVENDVPTPPWVGW